MDPIYLRKIVNLSIFVGNLTVVKNIGMKPGRFYLKSIDYKKKQ